MNEKRPKTQVEPLLASFRLRRPKQEMMADFAAGVRRKIEAAGGARRVGVPEIAFSFALVFAAAFFVYLGLVRFQKPVPRELVPAPETFSIEEEQTVLDALGEDTADAVIALVDFNQLDRELALLDEIEFNLGITT